MYYVSNVWCFFLNIIYKMVTLQKNFSHNQGMHIFFCYGLLQSMVGKLLIWDKFYVILKKFLMISEWLRIQETRETQSASYVELE